METWLGEGDTPAGVVLFILPIRDGNSSFLANNIPLSKLFILPIRDGNIVSVLRPSSSFFLFILPIRDGNFRNDKE